WSSVSWDGDRSLLIFGGLTGTGLSNDIYFSDYCLSPGQSAPWRLVTNEDGTMTPPPRMGHTTSIITHPGATMMDWPVVEGFVMFGGATDTMGRNVANDAWMLTRDMAITLPNYAIRWQPINISPASETPVGRYHHIAVWDTAQRRLLVYGGRRDDQTLLD